MEGIISGSVSEWTFPSHSLWAARDTLTRRGYVTVGLTVTPQTRDYCLVVDMRNLSPAAREHLCSRLQQTGAGGWWTESSKTGDQRLCADPDTWGDLVQRVVAAQRATGAKIRCLDGVRADAHAMAIHLAGRMELPAPTAECLEHQGAVDELLASWVAPGSHPADTGPAEHDKPDDGGPAPV